MTQLDTVIQGLHQTVESAVKKASESAKRADLHFENNSALRQYLLDLSDRIIDQAILPGNDPDFAEKIGIMRGMLKAADLIRQEAQEMLRLSLEDYAS
jgi:hypothetical protein